MSASSCSELTVETDWLDAADSETKVDAEALAWALTDVETDVDSTFLAASEADALWEASPLSATAEADSLS
ncbi:MAG: hypothetical protein ACOX1H_02975 [Pseudoramibacter sp.]